MTEEKKKLRLKSIKKRAKLLARLRAMEAPEELPMSSWDAELPELDS